MSFKLFTYIKLSVYIERKNNFDSLRHLKLMSFHCHFGGWLLSSAVMMHLNCYFQWLKCCQKN